MIRHSRVFYRGTVPGGTERIRTGETEWDSYLFVTDTVEGAKLYGSSIEVVTLRPGSRVLYEGTREFVNVVGRWRLDERLLGFVARAAKSARLAGYDAVHFKMQTDVGTAILNMAAILTRHPLRSNPPVDSYAYHCTNLDRAQQILETGRLRTYLPSYGTPGQRVWPDGSKERRAYFAATPGQTAAFCPEEGPHVLLRVGRSSAEFRVERGTGDLYVTKPISATRIEALRSGEWMPLAAFVAAEAQGRRSNPRLRRNTASHASRRR